MRSESSGPSAALTAGAFLKIPAIEVTEIFADAGYDHVVLDLEHSPLSLSEASRAIGVGTARGLSMLVRVPSHDPFWFQRCLDAGAAGVVVPHVDTGAQAEKVVASARFPPHGRRGVGPTSRQGLWGSVPLTEYMEQSAHQWVIAQIESREGVESIDSILASGVDAILIGPADLSIEMGVAADSDELVEARETVLTAAKAAGVACGIAAGKKEGAKQLLASGFDFTVVGNDLTLLYAGAKTNNPLL